MKHFFILIICSTTILINKSNGQNNLGKYICKTINLPNSKCLFTSFFVNDLDQVFIPVNGGIYMALDSAWLIPPKRGYYFSSFAPNVKDTGFFTFANTIDSSKLFYLKNSMGLPVKKLNLLTLERGIYNVIFTNNTCYVWGIVGNTSRIGIVLRDQVKWLFNAIGIIKQVQVTDSSEIYFCLNNSIYKLGSRQVILSSPVPIYGFCFNEHGNLFVSTKNGFGHIEGNNLVIVATGVYGIANYRNGKMFVCSNSKGQINILSEL